MKYNYCLPIIAPSQDEIEKIISEQAKHYSFFEVWLDYFEAEQKFINQICKRYPGKIIFVFRRKNLEKPYKNLKEQKTILSWLEDSDCLVDLDIYSQKQLFGCLGKHKTIVSYHNYYLTPNDKKLREIIEEIEAKKPYIIKLATYCKTDIDAIRLLKFLLEFKSAQKKYIVLGMGEKSKITRILGAMWDNEMTFVPLKSDEATAPGQITKAEFDSIMSKIK